MNAMTQGAMTGEPLFELGGLGNIRVRVAVEVGAVELTLREVMALEIGGVYPLDRRLDDPVEIMVNGRLVARGEIVSIGDRFGVRLTAIVSGLTG